MQMQCRHAPTQYAGIKQMHAHLCWMRVTVIMGMMNELLALISLDDEAARNTGQSLITLPVCVSQPDLHKPEAYQIHLMLIFTRPCTSSPAGLRHAMLRDPS